MVQYLEDFAVLDGVALVLIKVIQRHLYSSSIKKLSWRFIRITHMQYMEQAVITLHLEVVMIYTFVTMQILLIAAIQTLDILTSLLMELPTHQLRPITSWLEVITLWLMKLRSTSWL